MVNSQKEERIIVVSKFCEIYFFFTLMFPMIVVDGIAQEKLFFENPDYEKALVIIDYPTLERFSEVGKDYFKKNQSRCLLIDHPDWKASWIKSFQIVPDSYRKIDTIKSAIQLAIRVKNNHKKSVDELTSVKIIK